MEQVSNIDELSGRKGMVAHLELADKAIEALRGRLREFQERQSEAEAQTEAAKREVFKIVNAREAEVNTTRIEFRAKEAVEERIREDLGVAIAANNFTEAASIQVELEDAVKETRAARDRFRKAIKNFGNDESDDLRRELAKAEGELAALESGFIDDLLGRELPALREQYLAALAESWRILQALAIKKRFFPRLADPLKYEIDDGAILAAVRPYRFSLYRQ